MLNAPALILLLAFLRGFWASTAHKLKTSKYPKVNATIDKIVRRETLSKIGRTVAFGEYKWVVAIYHSQYEYPKCAGIVLTDSSVMTSCTCVTEEEYRSYAFPDTAKSLLVIAGNPDADNPFHESRTVVKVKVHPYCDPEWIGTRVDLAVLELNKSFQTDFYNHVGIVPRYSNLGDLGATKNELETFMNTKVFCDLVTFGYYDYEERPDVRKFQFINNHTMRALMVIFVQPSDHCNATCPNQNRCVYDYFGRETVCVAGLDDEVGPCGALPGSPVVCKAHLWGIYTGKRNCTERSSILDWFRTVCPNKPITITMICYNLSVPGAAAVPTIISFMRFFQGVDYDTGLSHSPPLHSKSSISRIILIVTFFLSEHSAVSPLATGTDY